MFVHTCDHRRQRVGFYACTSYHKRGRSVCANSLEVRMELADQAILQNLRAEILRPDVVDTALEEAIRLLAEPDERFAHRGALEAELTGLSHEIERLVTAISAGGDRPALVAALQDRERRRQDVVERLPVAGQDAPPQLNEAQLRVELRHRLRDWRGLLMRHVSEAREMLPEPITFTPFVDSDLRGYEYRGRVHFGRLLAGVIDPTSVASQTAAKKRTA
jgi:hypothetical protein